MSYKKQNFKDGQVLNASHLTLMENAILANEKNIEELKEVEPPKDGVSPTVSVESITGGNCVTVTDGSGDHAFDVMNGKSAYECAKDGGYTGTEAEFAEKLAESNDVVIVNITGDDTNGYTSDKTVVEIQTALDDGNMILARIGNGYAVLSHLLRDFSAVFTSYTSSNGKFSSVSYIILEMFGNKVDKHIFDTDEYEMPAESVTAGTFAGKVVANASGQDVGTSLLRNSKLVSADTNPTVNGEICWTYK